MINIREHITEAETGRDITFVKSKPDKNSAFERLDALKMALHVLECAVNDSDISNVPDEWHKAYATLTGAILKCGRIESEIIDENEGGDSGAA